MVLPNEFHRRAGPGAATNGLSLSRPWARPDVALPTRVAGFLTVANGRPEPDRLLAAASPLAEKVEIHAIKVVGADICMCPLTNGLGVPARTTIELKPRGYHLLLTGLKSPPAIGLHLPVTLVFERAGSREIELVVEGPGLIGAEILGQEAHRR